MPEVSITDQSLSASVLGTFKGKEYLPRERGDMFRTEFVPRELDKHPFHLLLRQDTSGRFSKGWNILDKAGLPVPKIYHISDAGEWIAVEDLTADGSKLYGRDSLSQLRRDQTVSLNEQDRAFISLVTEKQTEVKEAAQALILQAAAAGIELPWDDMFELRVKSIAEWQLIILDPEETTTRSGSKDILIANMNLIFNKLEKIWQDQATLLLEKSKVSAR